MCMTLFFIGLHFLLFPSVIFIVFCIGKMSNFVPYNRHLHTSFFYAKVINDKMK